MLWIFAVWPNFSITPWVCTACTKSSIARRISFLRGGTAAMCNCPPSSVAVSNNVTLWPFFAATRAASNPAGPPPTTTTFFFIWAGVIKRVSSKPFSGLTTQAINERFRTLSTQPSLQHIQRTISVALSAPALFAQSGSAKSARPIPIISALPFCSIPSPISGSIIRPEVLTGMETACLTAPVISAKKQ